MKNIPKIPLGLIIFGLIILFFPEVIAYLIGGFFLLLGINLWVISYTLNKGVNSNSKEEKEFVQFGKYKIYYKK